MDSVVCWAVESGDCPPLPELSRAEQGEARRDSFATCVKRCLSLLSPSCGKAFPPVHKVRIEVLSGGNESYAELVPWLVPWFMQEVIHRTLERESMPRLHLHLLSDSTGETLEVIAKAALAHFEGAEVIRHFWPMVRSQHHLDRIMGEIADNPGLVFFTLVNTETRARLADRCRTREL